jgi:phage major head subunit gpT-like protein
MFESDMVYDQCQFNYSEVINHKFEGVKKIVHDDFSDFEKNIFSYVFQNMKDSYEKLNSF